jgi:hypothetical protein
MKTAKLGLPGSVTVIGFVYLLALVLAPAPGAAAPAGETSPEAPKAAAGLATTAPVCPYTRHAQHVIDGFVEAHRTILQRPAAIPSMPAWGGGRLTVF